MTDTAVAEPAHDDLDHEDEHGLTFKNAINIAMVRSTPAKTANPVRARPKSANPNSTTTTSMCRLAPAQTCK